jgi:hypothetical protein
VRTENKISETVDKIHKNVVVKGVFFLKGNFKIPSYSKVIWLKRLNT